MLSCSRRETFRITSGPRSRRITLPPSGKRQPARALVPPLAEVHDLLQAFVLVRQLPFVNQQARRHLAVPNRILDAIERHDDVVDVGIDRCAASETPSSARPESRR